MDRLRPAGDGAEEAHLLMPAALCDRYCKRRFARIECHVRRIRSHGAAPMLEALTGATRSTLDSRMPPHDPPPPTMDMRSHGPTGRHARIPHRRDRGEGENAQPCRLH